MTRDELVELLTVERYAPAPARPARAVGPGPTRALATLLAIAATDDDVTVARRRRELEDECATYNPRTDEERTA